MIFVWTFIIILAIVFFVLAIGVAIAACLRIAGEEDVWLMREMEEKSIENAEEPIILGIDLAKEEEEK